LPLGVEGVVDSALPKAIEPTLYVRFGDSAWLVFLAAGLAMVVRRRLHP
jgi:apolipoprotein N-acyltransferase